MSEISSFLAPDPSFGVRLPAHEVTASMSGYLMGDWATGKVYPFLNMLLADYGVALTVAGETNITNMKTHFDGLTTAQKIEYFTKLSWYSVLLQRGDMTEAQWDGFLNV